MRACLVPLCGEDLAAYEVLSSILPQMGVVDLLLNADFSREKPDLHILLERLHIAPDKKSKTPTAYDILGSTLAVADSKEVTSFIFRTAVPFTLPTLLLMTELRRCGKVIIALGHPANLGEGIALVDMLFPFEDERTCELLHSLI